MGRCATAVGLWLALVVLAGAAHAQSVAPPASITLSINGGMAENRGQMATVLQLLAMMSLLTLAPALLIMLTSFTRIVIVLGFIRRALSTQEVPPTQVIIGLALFLTFFIMAPTWKEIHSASIAPYFANEVSLPQALRGAEEPMREFLFRNTRKSDLKLFMKLAGAPRPQTKADVPTYVLIPSFMVSELQSAFLIGFIIYVPFLIIDMVISSILLSMGMMILPPVIVSLPFKIILFVLVDGWTLVIDSLVQSFTWPAGPGRNERKNHVS